MKARIYTLLFTAICLTASLSLQAQEQNQSQGSTEQGVSVMPASSVDSQGIKKYLLGPGDTLDVRVFGQPDLNWQGEVDADGTLTSLPFIEKPISARCKTDKEVQKEIIAAYSKFLKSPQISVRVTGRNSRPPATILGAVLAPTRAQMQRRVRLNELIAASGGLTERANGDIQVLHTEPVMCPEPGEVVEPLFTSDGLNASVFKIYKFSDLLAGKSEANPVIRPGDIINVMDAKPVYITGFVAQPQPVLLREGMTLSMAIAMVGGARPEAKSNDVRIIRKKTGASAPEILRVDLAAIKKNKKPDVVLLPYDVIEVPKSSDFSPANLLKLLTGAVTSSIGGIGSAPIQALQYRVIY
ncbi:MAG: polysaccharide biosynthesis/export protein [Acidobacteriota bacterium]|jgi:polysaccharide export outer membrane protein|nr:polysaccharide biosynthesis/export protein [Acidobacteriota bacterium]